MSSSKKVTGSHLIGKALQLEGVKNIFTIAGDHILPVLDVMADMDFRFQDDVRAVARNVGGAHMLKPPRGGLFHDFEQLPGSIHVHPKDLIAFLLLE